MPQAPKQCQVPVLGKTTKLGVRSVWKGHSPLYVLPAFLGACGADELDDIDPLFYLVRDAHVSAPLPSSRRPIWSHAPGACIITVPNGVSKRIAINGKLECSKVCVRTPNPRIPPICRQFASRFDP